MSYVRNPGHHWGDVATPSDGINIFDYLLLK